MTIESANLPSTECKARVLNRSGDRPLEFDGFLLGKGSSRTGQAGRWVEVDIYLAAEVNDGIEIAGRRRLVIQVTRCTQWEGESDRYSIKVLDSADQALEYLREDGGGELGPASLEAWKYATNWVGLEDEWTEKL